MSSRSMSFSRAVSDERLEECGIKYSRKIRSLEYLAAVFIVLLLHYSRRYLLKKGSSRAIGFVFGIGLISVSSYLYIHVLSFPSKTLIRFTLKRV